MNSWKLTLVCLVSLSGCSDFGSEPYPGWNEYDLPNAQIYLPPELVRQKSVAALPENPKFFGVVGTHPLFVEFCVYMPLPQGSWMDYYEESITLSGKKAILFRGRGCLHMYDSHMSSMVGRKAFFRPDGGTVEVIVDLMSTDATDLAEKILMSLHH